jgi:hypothetical protein
MPGTLRVEPKFAVDDHWKTSERRVACSANSADSRELDLIAKMLPIVKHR